MTRSINLVSTKQPNRLSRIALAATIVAFCAAFVPAASANCGGVGLPGSQLTRSVPKIPALALSGPSKSADASRPSSSSIVGLWYLNFLSEGAVVDTAFDAWHSDGTEVLNDFTDPIEDNVCLGVWTQTGPYTYRLKHPSWYFDTTGTLQGTVIIHESITLSHDGNSFGGNFLDDVYDVDGNFLYSFSGQLSANRITAN